MTKKKSAPRKEKEQAKPRRHGRPWIVRFFNFLILPPVRNTLLVLVGISAIALFWGYITAFAQRLADLLGWGILLIAVGISMVVIWIVCKRYLSFFTHGYRWLGGAILLLAVWAALANFRLGGDFGQALIVEEPVSFLSVGNALGLLVIGLILMFPGNSYKLAERSLWWFVTRFRQRRNPKYLEDQLAASGTLRETPLPGARPDVAELETRRPLFPSKKAVQQIETVSLEKEIAASKRREKAVDSPEDLKQIAEDVWKKYGQSGKLVMVDGWKLPPIDILDLTPEVEFSEADNQKRARLIEEALGSYGVEAKVVQTNTGPTVTQFGVEPGWDRKYREIKEKDKDGNVEVHQEEVARTRVKVERITSLANDLALALAAPSIRIEAPVPGKAIVGIEVPNTRVGVVSMRGVIETPMFQKLEAKSKMTIALGKGAGGEAVSADLCKMPHLLIAGATGSGKTVCLNAIITGLLMYNTPNDLRFILVDPKRVELTPYNSIPHLATPVIVETDKALNALRWLNQEMDNRYKKMATVSARNIESYNKNRTGKERMPYLALVIDELADLMMTGFDEVEHILCRLAQLARATGIHLVVATQRPSVDVVTGLIKANFPTRISFAVTSQVDSRTVLDGAGAEKLLGRGDMLFMPTDAAKPKRLQGCFVSDPEIERLVYFWNSQTETETDQLKVEPIVVPSTAPQSTHPADPLLEQARQLAKEHERVSTSFLQRRLHIGYPRAARLMDQLEAEGFKSAEDDKEEPEA